MAESVLIPQVAPRKVTKGDKVGSQVLPALGAAIGGIVGGGATMGAGAIPGAAGGMALGNTLNNMLDIKGETSSMVQDPTSVGVQQSAASRRMAQMDSDPYHQIAQANIALQDAPKDVQDQYKKPLEEAMAIASRSRQQAASSRSGGMA